MSPARRPKPKPENKDPKPENKDPKPENKDPKPGDRPEPRPSSEHPEHRAPCSKCGKGMRGRRPPPSGICPECRNTKETQRDLRRQASRREE